MIDKYFLNFKDEIVHKDCLRLMKQLWKLIPMKEKEEDWEKQLSKVIIEIAGLGDLFLLENDLNFLILLSKLEGLKKEYNNISFLDYRKTVFDSIELLKEVLKYE